MNRINMRAQHRTSCEGFTLIEILVALAIMTIIIGIAAVNFLPETDKAKPKAARLQMQEFKAALNIYKMDHGFIPAENQGLEALVAMPSGSPSPEFFPPDGYLDRLRVPLDPWKNPYIYLAPGRQGESFEIISYGRDGEPGGENDAADISSSYL